MSVALLLITHGGIGKALLSTASTMIVQHALHTNCLEVAFDADPEAMEREATALISQLDDGQGVLVLTDIYGATPSNIACQLLAGQQVNIVTGLNLPMLLKILNHADNDLDALTSIAMDGGRKHIYQVSAEQCSVQE